MTRKVRVNADNVLLPDGGTYNTNDEVNLTDEQYEQLAGTALGDEVTDLGAVADTGGAVVTQAANVTAAAALTSAQITGGEPPTEAEYNALQADVAALRTKLNALLTALTGAGKPMAAP